MTAAPRLAAAEEGLLACVHCGLCLPACPTYRVLGDENDSPRGRVYLMRAVAEGRLAPESGAVRTHLGRCLGCRACETACPAGVPFGALLEAGRADRARASGTAAGLGRALLAPLTGRAAGPLYAALRTVRSTGLAGAAGRLPGRAGLAARLLDATRPARAPEAPSEGRGRRAVPAVPAEASGSYALLRGCVMEGLFGHVHRASRGVLAASGWREVPVPGQGCCGALHAHAGHAEAAGRAARRNVEAFLASGADRVVADAAGCGAALREYGEWLADDPAWAAPARRLAERVADVTELAAERPPAGARLEARVAYDAPCHLAHAQGVRRAPFRLLGSVAGLEVEPLPSADACCGGAGVYNLARPALSLRVLERKVEEIRSGGYDAVLTGNPGCVMQVGAGLGRAGSNIPVLHPVELVWRALGRPRARA